MSICNKQHLSNIRDSIHEKLSYIETEFNKCVAYKKACIDFANNLQSHSFFRHILVGFRTKSVIFEYFLILMLLYFTSNVPNFLLLFLVEKRIDLVLSCSK